MNRFVTGILLGMSAPILVSQLVFAAPSAIAVVSPIGTENVRGNVEFVPTGNTMEVRVKLSGLTPGPHGFHVHAFGDLSATKDGSSAGGHFNPDQHTHGGPNGEMDHHAGDLGNLEANSSGNVNVTLKSAKLSLTGPNSIVGRSIVIHASADDFKTQPAGNSGARIGWGVIGLSGK